MLPLFFFPPSCVYAVPPKGDLALKRKKKKLTSDCLEASFVLSEQACEGIVLSALQVLCNARELDADAQMQFAPGLWCRLRLPARLLQRLGPCSHPSMLLFVIIAAEGRVPAQGSDRKGDVYC